MPEPERTKFEGWVILELMGHRRLGGYLSEQELAGAAFLRIDVPGSPEPSTTPPSLVADMLADPRFAATQFYSPSSVYCITPTTEEVARAVAAHNQPRPVQTWELPAPAPLRPSTSDDASMRDDDADEYTEYAEEDRDRDHDY